MNNPGYGEAPKRTQAETPPLLEFSFSVQPFAATIAAQIARPSPVPSPTERGAASLPTAEPAAA